MSNLVKTYEQALAFLFDRVNYERTPASSKQEFKLDRMRRLLAWLDNPQERVPCIHIAGTKGKGSTAIMLAEMLSAAGYRVGLYTSPHVDAFEERMQVAGSRPAAEQLIELVRRVQSAVQNCKSDAHPFSPTFFEVTTALAWLFCIEQRAEIVVLEVGLGGRLDSTNVCSPVASVITTISRDHTQILGSTLTLIAREKAGIVKPGVPVISGVIGDEATTTIADVCQTQATELWQLGRDFSYEHHPLLRTPHSAIFGSVDVKTPHLNWSDMPLTLVGEHQAHNAAVAFATLDRLHDRGWTVSPDAARRGLANVRWPMRIEIVRREPTVILDAAHNWESAAALARVLDESFADAQRRVLIFAATKDKDIAGILRQLLPRFHSVILTRYLNNPRAVPQQQLARIAHSLGEVPCHVTTSPDEAWQLAQRIVSPQDLICITGSFFIAAEMRDVLGQRH